jgi:hypothetical protein
LRVRTRFLAIGVIAGLLAACTSSKADPKPTPSSAARTTAASAAGSATPTPSRTGPLTTGPNVRPGEEPPILPAIAHRRSDAGATAFGAYYFRALDWSIATNDATAVNLISDKACKACQRVSAAIGTLKGNHQTEVGGRIDVVAYGLAQGRFDVRSEHVVKVEYDEQAVRLTRSGAAEQTTLRAVRGASSYVFVSWMDGGWRIVEVEQA